jgi:putative FmdB family regulatory protein
MPAYTYKHKRLTVCADFEIVQRMADNALAKCPTCGKKVRRVIYAPAVKVRNASRSPASLFRQKYGNDKNYVVPETKEVVKLTGPKSGWEDQAYRAQHKAQPNLKRSEFKLLNA